MRRLLASVALVLLGCGEGAAESAAREPHRPSATASSPVERPPARTPPAPAPALPERIDPNGADPRAIDAWPPERYSSETAGDRVYSKVRHLWIRPRPSHGKSWVGYLSLGDSVRLKGGSAAEADAGPGTGSRCQRWYAVEPKGYVCAGEDATIDATDPVIVELVRTKADVSSPWPYRYGESRGTPVYLQPPDRRSQERKEPGLAAHLEAVARAREAQGEVDRHLVGVDLTPAGSGPPALLELGPAGRTLSKQVVLGSTLAYVDELDYEGRTFLLTWDRGYVPKDKVRPYPESHFRGLVLGGAIDLPLAFVRGEGEAVKYRREADGSFVAAGGHWPRLTWVGLTGEKERTADTVYYETREQGLWCTREACGIAEKAPIPPLIAQRKSGRRSWLDVSVLGGTLVAYEHETPVYATAISPGRGGIPTRGVPPLDTAATPTGTFSVLGKFTTATMVSGSISTLVHAEVQYTQNFSGPYALHGAYWHDRWGEKMSGGCVNLSPIDARRIFAWTDPPMPEGWHGMRSIDFPEAEKTVIVIRD